MLVENCPKVCAKFGVMAVRSLSHLSDDNTVPVRFLKTSMDPVAIYKDCQISNIVSVKLQDIVEDIDSANDVASVEERFNDLDDEYNRRKGLAKDNSGLPASEANTTDYAVLEYINQISMDHTHMNQSQKQQLRSLLLKYADVFALKLTSLRRVSVVKHSINTGDH